MRKVKKDRHERKLQKTRKGEGGRVTAKREENVWRWYSKETWRRGERKYSATKQKVKKILNARQGIVRTDSPIPCVLNKKGVTKTWSHKN